MQPAHSSAKGPGASWLLCNADRIVLTWKYVFQGIASSLTNNGRGSFRVGSGQLLSLIAVYSWLHVGMKSHSNDGCGKVGKEEEITSLLGPNIQILFPPSPR